MILDFLHPKMHYFYTIKMGISLDFIGNQYENTR